jgi:hypothetical protein
MIGTGLLLAIPFPSGVDLDYVKLGVKLVIALGIGALFGVAIARADPCRRLHIARGGDHDDVDVFLRDPSELGMTAPANARHGGGHPKRPKRPAEPAPWILRGRLLVQRHRRQVEMGCRLPGSRVATEHDARGAAAELCEVDPERVRVFVVIGVQRESPV